MPRPCACKDCESDNPAALPGSIYCSECKDCGLTREQYIAVYGEDPDTGEEVK